MAASLRGGDGEAAWGWLVVAIHRILVRATPATGSSVGAFRFSPRFPRVMHIAAAGLASKSRQTPLFRNLLTWHGLC